MLSRGLEYADVVVAHWHLREQNRCLKKLDVLYECWFTFVRKTLIMYANLGSLLNKWLVNQYVCTHCLFTTVFPVQNALHFKPKLFLLKHCVYFCTNWKCCCFKPQATLRFEFEYTVACGR